MERAGRSRLLVLVAVVGTVLGMTLAIGGWPGGPRDGTTTSTDVADELPAGVVVTGATGIESTVARQGEALSAAVTYLVERPVDAVLEEIAAGLGADWQQRSTSTVEQTQQVLYDGPDDATLTISAQPSVDGTAVAAVLARD